MRLRLRPRLEVSDAMLHPTEHRDASELVDRLRNASEANATLMMEIIGTVCRRFPSAGRSEKAARIEQLIRSGAWTDAALSLIDLELPLWQVRRIAYDEGEWYCALSRERELPDWLDRSIESRHQDLALAILSAFVEAERASAPSSQTSVPVVKASFTSLYDTLCCDDFG
jgi:hypothetical protein